ncbi:hypothetical protein FVER53590_13151 [Fusarium verticillioides]|nr:hypothetical protein FVER53590_13151 [Fusarium verticillioides]
MTNPDSVNAITLQQHEGTDQAWAKRALRALPNADSFRAVEGPWERETPRICDDELTPASEIQSGASSIAEIDTSQFDIATVDGFYVEYLIQKQEEESHRIESHDEAQYVAFDDDDATTVIPTGSSTFDENGGF